MAKKEKNERFITKLVEGSALSDTGYRMVMVDRETGVNYLYVHAGYSGGLTVMVDADGKPIVTPVSED